MSIMPQAMPYERVKIASLKFDPRNARKHDDRNIKAIMDSLNKFGQQKAIVVDDDNIVIAGNGTLEAAKRLGWDTIDVRRSGLKSDEATAYAIADNRSAELAEWDDPVLGDILSELKESGWELDDLGFNDDDLEKYIKAEGTEGLTNEDDVPEIAQNEFGVKRGDIWQLGDHRLMCGDSTLKNDVEKLFEGNQPILMVTDPPYGVNYDAEWREKALGDKFMGKVRTGKVTNDDKADWTEVYALSGCQIAYVWHASAFADVVMNGLREAGYEVKQQIIWNKTVAAMSRQSYHWKHEPCWYAVKKGKDLHWNGDRKQNTVWDGASPLHIMSGSKEEKTPHPTQKPTMIYENPIQNHLLNGESLYDPFSGSGSAIIACEKTSHKCFGMEIDPHYCSVIIKRWQDFTGKKAERIVEGA